MGQREEIRIESGPIVIKGKKKQRLSTQQEASQQVIADGTPAGRVVVRLERRSAVVGGGDRSVPVLASGVPNLGFDYVAGLRVDCLRCELHPDCCLGFKREFIFGKSTQ